MAKALTFLLLLASVPARARAKAAAPVVDIDALFVMSTAPVSPHAKIFLVAGSSETAAFAQEVVDERALWLDAGFSPDEIECYYVVPFADDLQHNRVQFAALAPQLATCHAASAKLLREHLIATGAQKPPFLFLYMTSHGQEPISVTLRETPAHTPGWWDLKRMAKYPVLDQHHLVMEGLPDGESASDLEIFGALRSGVSADDLYVTPAFLHSILGNHFAAVPKFVVLQACFSGGFFGAGGAYDLARLPEITLLAAARRDRSSFGCQPGLRTTFFGGIFAKALRAQKGDPRNINWTALSERVQTEVRGLERRRKVTPPSLPQFMTTHRVVVDKAAP